MCETADAKLEILRVSNQDNYVPLLEAASLFPKRPHRNSMARWVLRGVNCNGQTIRLQAIRSSGRWYTTARWVADFIALTTAASLRGDTPESDQREAQRRSIEAGRALQDLGC